MAGEFKLKGNTHIVDSSDIMTEEEIMQESYNLITLFYQFEGFDDVIEWLAKRRLIHNSVVHEECGNYFILDKIDCSDRYRWRLVFLELS